MEFSGSASERAGGAEHLLKYKFRIARHPLGIAVNPFRDSAIAVLPNIPMAGNSSQDQGRVDGLPLRSNCCDTRMRQAYDLQPKGIDQSQKRSRLLPPAGVVDEEPWERLAPIL